jgi:hypothetical protein
LQVVAEPDQQVCERLVKTASRLASKRAIEGFLRLVELS